MKRYIEKVWVDTEKVYAKATDGSIASYPIDRWERLSKGTEGQRQDFYLSYSGIHWPQLDEDLSFEGMFAEAGLCDRTSTEDSVCYVEDDNTRIVADDSFSGVVGFSGVENHLFETTSPKSP